MAKGVGSKKGGDYEVGYKKPPKHGQFKKGQSGNPAGRRKGKVTIAGAGTVFSEVMAELIPVNDNGKRRNMSILRALFMTDVKKALKNDNAASKRVLSLILNLLDRNQPESVEDSISNEAIVRELDEFLAAVVARSTKVPEAPN